MQRTGRGKKPCPAEDDEEQVAAAQKLARVFVHRLDPSSGLVDAIVDKISQRIGVDALADAMVDCCGDALLQKALASALLDRLLVQTPGSPNEEEG
jgi:hypothetical protein